MKIFKIMSAINGEAPYNYAKKDEAAPRELTEQELELLTSQKDQLDQLVNIAQEQFDISKEDRETYERVFRDADSPEAQEGIKDLQELMTGTRPTGQVTTDMLLRDVMIGSTGEIKKATEEFVQTQQAAFDSYEGELSGLSQEFRDTLTKANEGYQSELQGYKEDMGTVDQDIYSSQLGAGTAGISSAYSEARQQEQASLAQRGLAGSGIESTRLGQLYEAEARDKAGAIAQSRMQALGLSDARRMQQMGIAGTQFGANTNTAGSLLQSQGGIASQLYGTQAGLNTQGFSSNMAAYQQGISNLQALNAASQGIYVGAGNYMSQASSSSASGAQIAGSTATSLGANEVAYQQAQMEAQASSGSGIGSLAGTAASMFMMSDERLKENIEWIDVKNGHNIYIWDWIEGHDYGYNEGVIAQEVLETNPEAVVMTDSGYLAVDYSKLGV